MTFTPGIPNTGQSLGSTQAAIRNNFANYDATMSVNHVAPNSSGAGKHTIAEFVAQGSDPVTAASEITIYGKTVGSGTQLFVRRDNSGSVYQMTGVVPSVGSSGYTSLPGGIIIQWGNFSANPGGTATSFPMTFPNNCFSITAVPVSNTARPLAVSSPTTSGFTAYPQNNGTTVYYIAIGN
jgi:hypothetical protein